MIHVNNSSVSRDNVACGFVQGRLKPMLASCPWQILFEDVIESELEKEWVSVSFITHPSAFFTTTCILLDLLSHVLHVLAPRYICTNFPPHQSDITGMRFWASEFREHQQQLQAAVRTKGLKVLGQLFRLFVSECCDTLKLDDPTVYSTLFSDPLNPQTTVSEFPQKPNMFFCNVNPNPSFPLCFPQLTSPLCAKVLAKFRELNKPMQTGPCADCLALCWVLVALNRKSNLEHKWHFFLYNQAQKYCKDKRKSSNTKPVLVSFQINWKFCGDLLCELQKGTGQPLDSLVRLPQQQELTRASSQKNSNLKRALYVDELTTSTSSQ